jgi:hypothetical protein
MLVALPLLLKTPGFVDFFHRSPAELTDHFLEAYPRAFASGPISPGGTAPPEPAVADDVPTVADDVPPTQSR